MIELVECWPRLHPPIRAAITAMVRSAAPDYFEVGNSDADEYATARGGYRRDEERPERRPGRRLNRRRAKRRRGPRRDRATLGDDSGITDRTRGDMQAATKTAEPATALQLDPETVKAIRTEAGLTLAAAAEAVGVGLRAWQRWEQPADQPGHRAPRGPAAKAILALRDATRRKSSR